MSYTVHKSDGNTIIATVPDNSIDTHTTDLTFIGKNYSGYGTVYNENFVKLLENFATGDAPEKPIQGQLWYDSAVLKLKVYNGTAFVPVSSATVSDTQPMDMGIGDLWYNTLKKQLFFWDGASVILLGPSYTASQALSGIKVDTIKDSSNQDHVITCIYNNGRMLGFFSNSAFNLASTGVIPNFDGTTVITGFNQGNLENFSFDLVALDSAKLDGHTAADYFRTGRENVTDNKIVINSNNGLKIRDCSLKIEANGLVIENTLNSQPITIRVTDTNSPLDVIGIYPDPALKKIIIGSQAKPYKIESYGIPDIDEHLTNKLYVDTAIKSKTIMFGMTINGESPFSTPITAHVLAVLTAMAPPANHTVGTLATVLCSTPTYKSWIWRYTLNSSNVWELTQQNNIT